MPGSAKVNALLVTNSGQSNLEAALSVLPHVVLDVATPPVLNRFDYDLIVLHEFDAKLMLPGYYKEIERAAQNSTSVIVTAQESLADAKIAFLPVSISGFGNLSRNVVNVTNYFTDGIDFGVNERFLMAKAKEGTTTVVTADGSPVLVLSRLGSGTVVYYGLIDGYSSFKSSIGYPQFWSRLIDFLAKTEDLNNFNMKTGQIGVIPEQLVTTPSGKLKTERLLFDKSGFYSYSGKSVAANLLDVRESGVSSDAASFAEEERKIAAEASGLKEKKGFDAFLALLAAFLVFAELLYIKFRGDL